MALAFEAATVAGDGGLALAASSSTTPQASGTRAAAPPALGPAQAQDVASARLMARLQNRRIEVLGARTDASQTYVNADGSVTYTVSAQPVRVKRDGGWVNLDATLQLGADGRVAPVATESALSLSGGGSGALVSMSVDGKSVSLAWPSKLPMPVLSGDTATYANVLDGVDLQITASVTGGVEETLVVRTAAAAANPALADLVQSVTGSSGVSATTDAGGNLSVRDAKGRLLVNAPAPVMWDSATDATATAATAAGAAGASAGTPSRGTRSTAVAAGSRAHQAHVTAHMKDRRLHLTADHGLLTSKSTVFPVYIDPAYVPHPASGSTLHYDEVQQAYPTTSNWGVTPSGGLAVGYQGYSSPYGIERTYYNLSIPSSIYGAVIESAKLNTKVTGASAGGTNTSTVNVFSACAISTSTTWNNQPCKNQTANPNYPSPNASATFTTTSSSPNLPVTFDVTSGMQKIADIHNNNWTLGLFNATETTALDRVKFANNPTFSITYNHRPSKPTQVAPAAGASTNDTTPALQASATDADQDTVRELFQIDRTDGTTVVASGYSPYVNSGATATWSPTTALADGAYEWHASSYDGHNWWSPNSDWTAWRTFTVDTKAPGTSAITSTDFPAGAWSGTPDASGTFSGAFTFTPPAADTASVVWTLDGGAAHTHATTGIAVTDTITFPAGRHTLSVTTHDKAGNASAATSYVFYAGSGAALLTPAAGDRPARRVSLTAQGKSAETGVTYQYRIGETDTWHDVPVGDVTVRSSGAAVAGWPLATPGGTPAALTWNITDTLAQDGPVDVRAVFTDGTTGDNSPVNTLTVDRNAGSAPSLTAGPASVNALTGDAGVSATDASGFDMTVTRTASSRRPANGSAQEGQVAIFGPQWTAGTTAEITDSDWSYLHRTSSTSVALVDVDGTPTGFTATSGGGWKPEPGAEDLTLTGSLTGTFTLKDSDGTTTTFAKVDPAATAWQVASTFLPTTNSTTQVVSEKVASGTQTLARPKYVIAPTSAVTQSTCAATPATKGCRVLEYVYAASTTASASAFGDYAGQVSQIRLWATDPGASAATAVAVAQYAYDTTGRLRQEWDPRISPALKTAYDYDSAGRITTLTPPGELPWTLAYGSVGTSATAGDGMLVSASRPTLAPGSAGQTNGTATTSLVYDVPLTGSGAPYAMGGSDVAAWGQGDAPSDATALFPADEIPSSHDGATLGSGDYRRATLTYTDPSGREVNTAEPGGHLTTTEYDRFGNTVRELTAANRELALATGGSGLVEQQQLGIDTLSSADRAQLLSTTSVFNAASVAADAGTDKNTDPADAGQRELEKSGPLHMVTLASALHAPAGGTDLPAGSPVAARQHTVTAYDQGRPTDGTATVANQATTVTVGAAVDGYPADGDTRTSTTGYDWVKGLPTQTVTDPTGLDLVKTTSYDAQGRVVRTTLPKSDGTDAGATVTTYWSATGTGTCTGRPEWADLVCTVGPAGAITGGGSNPTDLPTKSTDYDRWGNTGTVTDAIVIGGNAFGPRHTTNTYDAAGRLTKTAVTGGVGTAVPDTSTTYDPATGQVATTGAAGHTISKGYDALGRQITYNDGAGNTATTWYDALNRPTRVTDSVPSTTTYTYDTALDPRGLETSRTDSVAGTLAATYDADGDLATESLPGGYTLTVRQDETGTDTSRSYTRDSDGTEVAQDSATDTVQGQQATHSSDTGDQTYGYDAAGRLTTVNDTQDGITTHRAYAFDDNTNRTGLTTTVDNPDGTAGTPATVTSTYDSADRIQTAAGTGGIVYDAFGRTTTQATGATIGYYTNDLVRQQTSADGTTRQTWTLDPAQRLASWTTEVNTAGTWAQTAAKTNHYGGDGDSPDWTAEDAAGTITRNVQGIGGDLAASTGAGDATSTDLMLTNLHGDVTVQLPLDASASPTALAYDEFGNPENDTPQVRYGWLGGKQRSSETPTGATLMGVRLFDPSTGRFLSTDPDPGGSANAYDYCNADPINCYDIDGQWPHVHWHNPLHVNRWNPLHHWGGTAKHAWRWTSRHARRRWHSISHNHYFRACAVFGSFGFLPAWAQSARAARAAVVGVDWWGSAFWFGGGCVGAMVYYRYH